MTVADDMWYVSSRAITRSVVISNAEYTIGDYSSNMEKSYWEAVEEWYGNSRVMFGAQQQMRKEMRKDGVTT
jgi:hypothetical protein